MKFTVYGIAQTAGSKRHVGNGRIIDSNRGAGAWKDAVASAAMHQSTERNVSVHAGPLAVEMRFFLPRPKGHYSKRRERGAEAVEALGRDPSISGFESRPSLLPSAPAHPVTRPDVLKLARCVEDALTGVVYRDDAQIVTEALTKRYGEPARVEIRIIPAERDE